MTTRANKSSREFVQFFEVLGLMDAETEEEMRAQIEERKANTPRGKEKRHALVEAMELKDYEFNAHGVDLGQFYESTAIQNTDGATRPAPARDPELYYQASTVPGSHLPHAWVGDAIHKVSTLDLAPYDTFTLITGIAGEAWQAAAKVGADLGVPLKTVIIGPGREVTDIYYDWARLREVDEDGVLLVRPDKFIGWRAMKLPADPEEALRSALENLLSRPQAAG